MASSSISASASSVSASPALEDVALTRSVPAQSQSPPIQSQPASAGPKQQSLPLAYIEPVESHASIHGLAGRSPVMRRLIMQMGRMAPHLPMATIEGPDGSGRSMAARALHAAGPAAERPFVPCLANQFFPQTALDGTGVTHRHPWSEAVLRQAAGGMLFLDRVHQLSEAQQQALAEFLHWFDDRQYHLQQQSFGEESVTRRSSSDAATPAQIVFSSSVPLRDFIASNFREDLASRLCAVRFRLPSLVERREDIPLLAQIFIQRFARAYGKPVRGLGPGTIAPLLRHGWPGNVRELEETITAAALDTESQWIRPIDLPPFTTGGNGTPGGEGGPDNGDSDFNLDRAIRNHVNRVLSRTRGNKLRAARLLGISRSTLYRILAAEPSRHLE